MRFYLIFVITLFISQSMVAQKINENQIKAVDTVLLELKNRYAQTANDSIKYISLLKLSYHQVNRDAEDAIEALDKALLIYESEQYNFDPISLGYIYEVYASAYRHQGKYTGSLDFFHKAKNIFSRLNDSIGIARINHSISVLYTSIGDKERSKEYIKKAIKINRKISNKKALHLIIIKLASFLERKNKEILPYTILKKQKTIF